MSQFAEPLPATVIGRLIGLAPERATEMRMVALRAFAALGTEEMPERMGAFAGFGSLMTLTNLPVTFTPSSPHTP